MALTGTITDMGHLTKEDKKALEKAVKAGILDKGKGLFPKFRHTVYALKGHDFEADRREEIEYFNKLARLDTLASLARGERVAKKYLNPAHLGIAYIK